MYKPITEYTEQELAAMRCWEILTCHLKWMQQEWRKQPVGKAAEVSSLSEPYAAIYGQALDEFKILTSRRNSSRLKLDAIYGEMESWMDAHHDEIFPPEQPK